MLTENLAFIAALALGMTFLTSSLGKLRDTDGFVLGVLDYQVLPPRLAIAYGRLLPFAELLCGMSLVLGVWSFVAGFLATSLLLSFVVAVVIDLVRGRQLACHCFGSQSSEPLAWPSLVRLCVLLVCAMVVTGWRGHAFLVRPPGEPIPSLLLALGLVVGLYLLGAVQPLWRIWHTPVVQGRSLSGGRVSLRSVPIERRPPPATRSTEVMQGR